MKKAFTLAETTIVIILLGILGVTMLSVMRPSDIKKEALIKSGANMQYQIDFATKRLLAKNSNNYTMTRLKTNAGAEFSIAASGADAKLITIYKDYLKGLRNKTPDASYLASQLQNEAGTKVEGIKVSSFTQGFSLKNSAYFAIKLNGNCTTSETYIYSPSQPSKRTANNSCGLIFFDVNGSDGPNYLGVDQYVLSIGKLGVR